MKKTLEYLAEHRARQLDELFAVLRIPSVSAQTEHKADMTRCAEALAASLRKAGADRADVMPTAGNPVVFAQKNVPGAARTVMVYGHYDVMPAEPLDEWKTSAFEPVVKDGRIWGRGADDDKGQLWMHVAAFEAMCATGELPCNVKFLLEGEEEIGSPSLYDFCRAHKELLQSDVILVSDTSMFGLDTPSVTVGLRGLCYMQVTVQGPDKDLHSGLFGGAVANPANVLTKLIGDLIDSDGRVTIEGFYDDVQECSCRVEINEAPYDEAAYKRMLDIDAVSGERGYTTLERTGIRPSLDVNGMWSGYTQPGTKTIVPAVAQAKISMRLVPNQTPKRIAELFTRHFERVAPQGVRVKCEYLHGGMPYVAPTTMPAYRAASAAISESLGRKPLPFYSGGSIPIVSGFEQILGIKSLLLGFGLARDAIHSPNESFGLDQFDAGTRTIPLFYKHFAAL